MHINVRKERLVMKFKVFGSLAAAVFLLSSCFNNDLIGNWVDTYSTGVDRGRGDVAYFQIGNYGYVGLGYASALDYDDDGLLLDDQTPSSSDDGRYREYGDWTPYMDEYGLITDYISKYGYMNDFWRYDAATGNWKEMASFPSVRRMNSIGFSIGDYGFVGLGQFYNGEDQLECDDFWMFIPPGKVTETMLSEGQDLAARQETGLWRQIDNFPDVATNGRHSAMAFVLDDVAYVGTGYGDGGYFNDMYKLVLGTDENGDPIGEWISSDPMQYKHKCLGSSTFILEGEDGVERAYVVSGTSNSGILANVWSYCEAEGWVELKKLDDLDYSFANVRRTDAVGFTLDYLTTGERGYIATGNNGNPRSDVWEYYPAIGEWYEKTSFEGRPRNGAAAFVFGNEGYIALGANSASAYSDMFKFIPYLDFNSYD